MRQFMTDNIDDKIFFPFPVLSYISPISHASWGEMIIDTIKASKTSHWHGKQAERPIISHS